MNEYGQLALRHWRRWCPERVAAIAEAEGEQAYFTRLGVEVAQAIAEMAANMTASEAASLSSDYLTRVGQLNMIRHDAEQAVLRDRVFLPPEPGVTEGDAKDDDSEDDDSEGGAGHGEASAQAPVDPADAAEFQQWKADTLAALAGGRLQPADLEPDDLARLREATHNPRLLELAGIRDEDLRAHGLL